MTKSIGRPAKGKTMRLLNHLDHARVGARLIFPGKMDGAAHAKTNVIHNPKPVGKMFSFRDGIPDTLTRDGQDQGSFDTIRKSHWLSSQVKPDVRVFCLIGNSQIAY